jgi:hypothetical protein
MKDFLFEFAKKQFSWLDFFGLMATLVIINEVSFIIGLISVIPIVVIVSLIEHYINKTCGKKEWKDLK